MKKIKLGNSNLEVSRFMIGCWSFGGEEGSYWGEQKQADVNSLVAEAIDRGVNFFDTAIGYNNGKSESSLGIALKGRRKDVVICDKIQIIEKDKLKDHENILLESLKRLNTDYIDVMMIHWPGKDMELVRLNLAALLKAQEKGIIREIGVSNFPVPAMKIAHELGVKMIANEFSYNLMCRGIEREVLPYCRDNNIGILAYMPLMQGILTGKYRSISDIPLVRRRTVHFSKMGNPHSTHGGPGADAEVEALLSGLKNLSEKTGLASGTLAIAWLFHQAGVACALVGCRNVKQLHENITAIETELSAELVEELNNLSRPILDKVGQFLDVYRGSVDSKL